MGFEKAEVDQPHDDLGIVECSREPGRERRGGGQNLPECPQDGKELEEQPSSVIAVSSQEDELPEGEWWWKEGAGPGEIIRSEPIPTPALSHFESHTYL